MVKGNPALCELDHGFCQQAMLIDAGAKTVELMPTTKFSKNSRKARVEDWSDTQVVFYDVARERPDTPDKPGFIEETKSTLNRVTGAYVDWTEYRRHDGTVMTQDDIGRRNAAATHRFELMGEYERRGTCKPSKPLF
jgi:hypothetical protein